MGNRKGPSIEYYVNSNTQGNLKKEENCKMQKTDLSGNSIDLTKPPSTAHNTTEEGELAYRTTWRQNTALKDL